MKNLILLLILTFFFQIIFTSCSPKMGYSYGGSPAGCTAFWPKKYKGDRGKGISPIARKPRMVAF